MINNFIATKLVLMGENDKFYAFTAMVLAVYDAWNPFVHAVFELLLNSYKTMFCNMPNGAKMANSGLKNGCDSCRRKALFR